MGSFRCSDEAFLAELGLPCRSRRGAIALAVRAVIAITAEVHPGAICAHHTFADDLTGRGMFDDSLDTVEFVMNLEDQIRYRIRTAIAEKLPGLIQLDFPHPLFTVADFVVALARYLEEFECRHR